MFPEFRLGIVGRQVVSVELDVHGLGLSLTGGWSIRIHGPARMGPSTEVSAECLVGATLLSFAGDHVHELLIFDNGNELTVDLCDEIVAESMVIHGPNNVLVIWP